MAHVVVVGAGTVGASIAFHLSLRGAQITIVDAAEPGQGTSRVSFAWINGRDKTPRHYHDLNRRSLDMWDRFARRLGGDVGLTWGGELRWAATQREAVELTKRVNILQSWGYPIRLVEPDELLQMEPGITFGPVIAASYTPIDGHVETGQVIRACLKQAMEMGAEVRANTRVLGFQSARSGTIQAVQTGQGDIECDAIVLAVGADTPEIAALAGIEVPLYHTFGATIITTPLAPVFRQTAVIHTPRDADPQINIRQLPDGSMMLHGGSHGGAIDRSLGQTEAEIEQVVTAATRLIPALKGTEIREIRRGRRPIPQDGHPILGFTQPVPNLYIAAMHSGVTLAPLVGELAAIEIVDRVKVDMLEPYRLERFG